MQGRFGINGYQGRFLTSDFEETIYMEKPKGFVEDESKVCCLNKSLYGLEKGPR